MERVSENREELLCRVGGRVALAGSRSDNTNLNQSSDLFLSRGDNPILPEKTRHLFGRVATERI